MLTLLLFLLPPALVWGFLALRGRSLLLMATAVVISEVVFGPVFFGLPGLDAVTINRLMWGGMLCMFGLYWYANLTDIKPLTGSDLVLFVFCAYILVSTLWGGETIEGANPVPTWLFRILLPLGIYCVAKHSQLSRIDVDHVLLLLIGLGAYLGITGICEGMGWYQLVFPRFITDPSYLEFFGRARGPLMNPIGNGIFLGTALAAAVALLPHSGRTGRVALFAVCAVTIAGIYFTKTRSCWISAILGVAIVTWTYWPRHVRLWGVVAAIFFAAILGVAFKDDLLRMKRDKHLSAEAAADSANLRPLLAVVAWEMFKDHPFTGVGFRHYRPRNLEYTELRPGNLPTEKVRYYVQHNVLLAFLVETGLIGVSLLCLVLACWTRNAFQLINSVALPPAARTIGLVTLSLIAAYLVNGMFHDVSVIEGVNTLLFLAAGIASGLSAHRGVLPNRIDYAADPISPAHVSPAGMS